MKSMIHAIWVWWKGSACITNASGRSFIIAANAVSNSMRGLTLTEMTITPNVGAAACTSSNWRTLEALSGFQSKAGRDERGGRTRIGFAQAHRARRGRGDGEAAKIERLERQTE